MIHWNNLSEFLAMGGYAGYVWGSFGATALLMAFEPLLVSRKRRETISRLKRQMRAESAGTTRNTAE